MRGARQRRMFVDEPLEQRIDRNAQPFGLVREARFGFSEISILIRFNPGPSGPAHHFRFDVPITSCNDTQHSTFWMPCRNNGMKLESSRA